MTKTKQCRRCHQRVSVGNFVDTSGKTNERGHFCQLCHQERVAEWHQEAINEENSLIRKLKIVYGEYWQHYASPDFFLTSLRDERDFCLYCGIPFSSVIPNKFNDSQFHLDHMDPLDKGGEHSTRNVVFCCTQCNIKKGKISFLKWLEMLEPIYRELSIAVYVGKHEHRPEEFIKGCKVERGSIDSEFCIYQSEESLRFQFQKPKIDRPPSNQPVIIKLDIMKAIEALPDSLKEKLKRS